ncbi:uncharacterized protein tasor2 isoform X2 [Toxotes jaculatrix]|uniref:uncharacterized protein tasor2 isoform X2 n=1 Tax=Toxotes jaculatrix TaxID=941984 RepID=UPI001B3A7BCD|nr:uncharacterized protein tasor2 isoform X2 [Toxotes jaculatrix]
MESGNGGASSKGVLLPVSDTSDVFKNSILAPLQSAYLYEESKQSFRYKSAVLIKNPVLEEKYNAFRAKIRDVTDSEEDLKETYGFLLFDDLEKAHAIGETGVLTGNSSCTTLGDPWKGVYISMYSDCLDLNRWYHGKSGYIAIIRLTKGRVKRVLENYTQNFTAPTVGFDCHVSEQLSSVSAKTSSFLAFERTQYYMYELLDDGSSETAQCPSAACPFAIVSFSYSDTKATPVAPQETREEKKQVSQYFAWRGQLQIGTRFCDVGLRSTTGTLIPAKLPPVVKVDRAISTLDLIKLLPRTVFETCFSGEVFLDGLYYSLCELLTSEAEETNLFSLLLREIKEKDLALPVPLNDGGFLILLHPSHFFTYDDTGSNATEVLRGMFVFPDSRVIQKDTKSGHRKTTLSSEILRVLPVLSYAEGEIEKTPFDSNEKLCEVLVQHMQNYAALINPGLALSPSRESSIFPDQYDVLDGHRHLYSSPEWTNRAWQSFRSYISKPVSFQLPVSKASEILAAGQEEQREDLDDDVYICLSSPEEAPTSSVGIRTEDQLTDRKSPVNVETSEDSYVTSTEAQVDLTAVPQNVVPDDLQAGDKTKDTEKSGLTILIKTDDSGAKNLQIPATSEDLSAELIVSITSAERTVTDESVISTMTATKHNDFQLSGFSAAKLQTPGEDSLHDETATKVINKDCPELTSFTKTKQRRLYRGHTKGLRKASKAGAETLSSQTVNMSGEDDISMSQKDDQDMESSGLSQLNSPLNIALRKFRRRKRKFGKLSSKNKKVREREQKSDPGQQNLGGIVLMEPEVCPLRKKTERWDLKPVLSECGQILVPHGSIDFADQIRSFKDQLQCTKNDQYPEKMPVDASVSAHDKVEMEQESSTSPETAVDKREATTSKDGGNHLQNVVAGRINAEHSLLRQSDDGSLNPESSKHSSKDDGTDTSPSEAVKEKHTNTFSPGKCATVGDFLLSKLKSVLLRGKRKNNFLALEGNTTDTAQNTEPCLKKGKVDSDAEALKSNNASVPTTSAGAKEVSEMLSVDPVFAYALGLTPKEKPNDVQKSEGQDSQLKKASSETQEQTILDKHPQIIQKSPSIFPRRGRIKTLKRHQGIPAEHIKKKCTPFQVSPLSGSTRLLHHHPQLHGGGIQTLHPSVCQNDRGECNHRTSEYLKKHLVRRRKFRHSRTFVNKDGSVQVTRQWKENYDFNRDSKFSSDSKDKAILRALHGPWDFSIQDTTEEVQLIVHMWIGLFYSRSTARFFDIDSNLTYPCSEESDSLEMSSGIVSASDESELKANSCGAFPSVTDTQEPSISKALDLSKRDDSVLDQGSVILDLSLRNTRAETVTPDSEFNSKGVSVPDERKEGSDTLNMVKSSMRLQECHKKFVDSTEIFNEENDVRSIYENKKICSPLQKDGCLEHTDDPSPLKGEGSFIPPQEKKERASIWTENDWTSLGIDHVSHRCNKEKTHMKDAIENSETTEMSLVQKQETDPYKSITNEDEEVESNKEADQVLHTDEHDEIDYKDGKNWEMKENPCHKGKIEPSPKVAYTDDDSANKQSGIICDGALNEKQLSREEPKAVSPGKAENVNEDVDFINITAHEDKMTADEDRFGKDSGLDEKDSCLSAVGVDSDLRDQPLPKAREGSDSAQKDCLTDCSRRAPFDEPPPQEDNEEDVCHDLQRKLCANRSALSDEHAISEKAPDTSSEMEPVSNEPAAEENSENICLEDKDHDWKAALPISDESTCSLDGSCVLGSVLKTEDSLETGGQNTAMAVFSFGSSDGREDQQAKSVAEEKKDEPFHHESHSPQCEVIEKCEDTLTKETDLKMNKINDGLEKSHSGVVIPFIGIDISGEDIVQPHCSHSQRKIEDVQDRKGIPFISETTSPDLPTEVCSTPEMYCKKKELSAGKISLLDVTETNQPVVLGSESDERCPTPTVDEKPHECIPYFGPDSSTSAFSSSETCKNIIQECLNRTSTPTKDEMSLEQNLVPHSSVNSDPNPHCGLQTDLELRTLRVLQTIDKYLSESKNTDKSNHIETADVKHCLQTPDLNSKYIPTYLAPNHTSPGFNEQKISNSKPAVVSASTSEGLHQKSSDNFLISPFKIKLEEVLGVPLQLKKTDSPLPQHYFERTDKSQETLIGQDCHSYTSIPSAECLQTIKPNVDQDRHKTSQFSLNHESRSYSQRPVMAVKPSKSDESQADFISEDGHIEHSPSNKKKTPVVAYTTPTTMPVEKKTENFRANSGLNNDEQESSEFTSKSSWFSYVSDSKSNLDKTNFPSFVGQTNKEDAEMDQKDCSEASTSFVDYKDNSTVNDSPIQGPQSSLICTVYNTSRKRSYSFLEQVSQRGLQDDLTQASMEQECLIFSEQMKQFLKRSKRGPNHQQDTHDKLKLSCASPMTVNFSSLEEQEDSLDLLDKPSLVGQKIKVDMSNRKDMRDSTENEKTQKFSSMHPQKLSSGTGNLKDHAGVSSATADWARRYEAMMEDVCAVKKVPSRPKNFRMDRDHKKTESNHFDFCDQMKKEMDESFRSNLNSVVKKSCKTKYRFYILVTSDDALFEETKGQLEAEGHIAVQPSEFFLGEDSSSPLLIILRNEDIAEHIFEVPHLLELKKSPGVLFAGIDEPDDVVNLTHQELFMRGGFIMFDRAALEPLTLCNLKKFFEILQELSRTGKWKWMLHYRDSRRLKENARLSAEAKEKKHFLNSCQDAGMLDILPYHECDLMSRDQPDYLTCLLRLQVQNISARYPIFITDTTTDGAFGRNGILTMTVNSFLTNSLSEMFTV